MCIHHKFDSIEQLVVTLNMRIRCKWCGGHMRVIDIRNYCLGFKAAGGNPDHICEGLINPNILEDGR